MKNIRTWKKTKIMRRMLTVCIFSLLPLLIVGVVLLVNTGRMLNKHYLELLEADNRRVRLLLSEFTRQAYNDSAKVWFDDDLEELLKADYDSEAAFEEAANSLSLLDNLVYQTRAYYKVTIYTDNSTIHNYKQFRAATQEIQQTTWYRQAINQTGAFWTSIRESKMPTQNSNLSLVRAIHLPGSSYRAVAVLTLSDSDIRGSLDFGGCIDVISVDEGGVVYSSKSGWYGQPIPLEIDYSDYYYRSSGRTELEGQKYFAVVSTLRMYMTNSRMNIGTIHPSGVSNIHRIIGIWIAVLVLSLVIPLGILEAFLRHFSGRVALLRAEIRKARFRDYNMLEQFSGDDELTEVYRDLCLVVADIKQKDAKMYQAELHNKQQRMEYKMLASQINPHYLYNTLETIRMKALTGGNREVAASIKLLGKTMHYVLENTGTEFTVLRRELDHVTNYLSIQKLRFGDRINYSITVSEEVDPDRYLILPLLLQPVVENAVVHGLEGLSGMGVLEIKIERTAGGSLLVQVVDNGTGIPRQELERVQQMLRQTEQPPQSGVALYNIQQRIRLCYGEGYGVTVESEEGRGTSVILELPGTISNR